MHPLLPFLANSFRILVVLYHALIRQGFLFYLVMSLKAKVKAFPLDSPDCGGKNENHQTQITGNIIHMENVEINIILCVLSTSYLFTERSSSFEIQNVSYTVFWERVSEAIIPL